jgi:transposase InsO family protein
MRYAFIAAERASFPVRRLCRLIGVAASAFYAWLRRGPIRRAQDEAALVAEIKQVFEQSSKTYGSPRIHAELRARGRRIGRKRIARLMREQGLIVPRKKRRLPVTTDSRHNHPIAPNLGYARIWVTVG